MASGRQGAPSAPHDSRPSAVAANGARPRIAASLPSLSLAALGVVFRDIGTSPLYTLKTVLSLAGDKPDAFTVLGSLSLVIWTLIIITWVKYVTFAMRIDNDGEGGILALMSLLSVKRGHRPTIIAVGLFGAALIYGDGAITPAISVLSALEGLKMVAPAFNPYVLPAAVAVLIGLFALQPQGSAKIGKAFGPCLVLNYAGQGALVLGGAPTADNIFFRLCPPATLLPMVVLATVATIIASQSIITGAFSLTRQAIQLGWMPRLPIKQTSEEGYGQIYVGPVNWLLMLVTLALTVGFGRSDNLAAAYGIAVSATMLMTSALLFIAMREIWRWSIAAAGAVAGVFVVVDAGFVTANLMKIANGGYVPLVLAALVYGVMWVWHLGSQSVSARIQERLMPIGELLRQLN